MRCPDCNKMVSYDTEMEPEEQDEPKLEGETFTAEYRRVLGCADCGTELKEATLEFDDTIEVPLNDTCPTPEDHEWELDVSPSPTEGRIDVDRRGKKITNPRYMKTTYGVSVSGKATCTKCKAEVTIEAEMSETASAMDELT